MPNSPGTPGAGGIHQPSSSAVNVGGLSVDQAVQLFVKQDPQQYLQQTMSQHQQQQQQMEDHLAQFSAFATNPRGGVGNPFATQGGRFVSSNGGSPVPNGGGGGTSSGQQQQQQQMAHQQMAGFCSPRLCH
ncbi:hypothetical protein TYRP_021768 [Tyrophagus putrescentiae]|nr:hypothetical protein TYRP_021768 [Tyrophagus putrescentiae]